MEFLATDHSVSSSFNLITAICQVLPALVTVLWLSTTPSCQDALHNAALLAENTHRNKLHMAHTDSGEGGEDTKKMYSVPRMK